LKYYINQKLWWKENVFVVYIRGSKAGAESKKETLNILCSEGGREDLGRIVVLCKLKLVSQGSWFFLELVL
jgi:hypothetical protein